MSAREGVSLNAYIKGDMTGKGVPERRPHL
jgi:hypothetical protein